MSESAAQIGPFFFLNLRLTHRDLPTLLVSRAKRYVLSAQTGFKRCFGVFVLSQNSLLINFYRYQDLVHFLQQFARKAVDDNVESSNQN